MVVIMTIIFFDYFVTKNTKIMMITMIIFKILSPAIPPDNWGELGQEPRPEIGDNPFKSQILWLSIINDNHWDIPGHEAERQH